MASSNSLESNELYKQSPLR